MAKRECAVDIETYSDIDIDRGVYAYVDATGFEIILVAYKFSDEAEVKQFMPAKFLSRPGVMAGAAEQTRMLPDEGIEFNGDEAEFLNALRDGDVIKTAHNANFERTCLAKYYGVDCDPDAWRCTMVLSAAAGLPLSLKDVGNALDLSEDEKKLRTGKALIQFFCRPLSKPSGGRERNLPRHDMDRWRLFCEYNRQDVVTEQAIRQRLKTYQPNVAEQKLWSVDQRICDRGIRIDRPFVETIVRHDAERQEILKAEAQEITGLENPNSVSKLKDWFVQRGFPQLASDLSKDAVSAALKEDAPPEVKRVLEIRQALGKTSTAKYGAMLSSACHDDRVRGMLQFYGASRTGRWSGRIVQLQNLPQNHIPDLDLARQLVANGDFDALELLYGETGQVLSELVRTAFIPSEGCRFVVTDFSAIEARVIAWLAGEEWRLDVFRNGGDIYCQSASQMFHVPVVKHGENGHLRQKGKVAELACLACGSPVLTDRGLIPIQDVTADMKLWDGENWVTHDGVICRGKKEVITYDGLTATPDHLVWVEGQSRPIQFGIAATCGAHLIQTGNGGQPIRLGQNYQPGKALGGELEPLLCSDAMHRLWSDPMAESRQPANGQIQGMPSLLTAKTNTKVAGSTVDSGQATLREPEGLRISQLWRQGYSIPIPQHSGGGALSDGVVRNTRTDNGIGQNRHERALRARESSVCDQGRESGQQAQYSAERIRSEVLAVCPERSNSQIVSGTVQRGDNQGCGDCGIRKAQKLARYQGKVRVYDIRNAGPHHRFTVSGKLVHNCGYGGGIGAIKAMDKAGTIPEDEIKGIVDRWREASPAIVKLWGDYEKAALMAIREERTVRRGIRVGTYEDYSEREYMADGPVRPYSVRDGVYVAFSYKDGNLQVRLPSGRKLTYWGATIGKNRFGKDAVHYMGTNQTTRKWVSTETWGGTLVENITQATARDCLAERLMQAEERGYKVVAHVHDEMIIDVPKNDANAAKDIDDMMAAPINWAPGLPLKGGTYECDYYQKD